MHDGPAQVADRPLAVDAFVGAHDHVDGLVANRVGLRLQPRLGDQLQALDVFVLAAGRQQQDAAIGRIGLLARHDTIRPGHAPALDAAVERKLDADEAQHVVVLLRLDRRDALLDVGLAHGAIEHIGAHRHLARVVNRAIERHLPLVDAGLDHADDAVGIEIAHRDLQQLRHVGRRRRENLAHQIGGGLEQHAGRFAVGDRARSRRLPGSACPS